MNCEIHPGQSPKPPVAGQAALKYEVITAERLARWMKSSEHKETDITRGQAPEGYLEVFLWGWPGRDFVKYITFSDYCRLDEVLAERKQKHSPSGMSAAPSEFRSSDVSSAGPCRQG